jgi:hypothetical protein
MTVAKHALEELSSDPNAQRLAQERETAVLMRRHLLAASRNDGQSAIIGRQLAKKFGVVPEWAQERLRNASSGELEIWADRILVAGSVEEVFGA